jgi:hypothetical protein
MNCQTDGWTEGQMDEWTDTLTDRKRVRQTDRQTASWTVQQIDRMTEWEARFLEEKIDNKIFNDCIFFR